jgi:hypothetical protein
MEQLEPLYVQLAGKNADPSGVHVLRDEVGGKRREGLVCTRTHPE